MGLIDDLKKWAHPYEDEDEEYEDDFAELGSRDTGAFADERPSRRERDRDEDRRNKVVNIHATTQLKVVLVKPERFENASEIADHLKEKRTVVINLESTNKDIARRSRTDCTWELHQYILFEEVQREGGIRWRIESMTA